MKKILFVATEFAPGMVPFASTIINTLKKCNELDVYAIVVDNDKRQYYSQISDKQNIKFINYPNNKLVKLIYKFYPLNIINEINYSLKHQSFDAIHFLTGDFSLYLYIRMIVNKSNLYYTVHDLSPHESNSMSLCGKLLHKYVIFATRKNRELIHNLTTSSISQLETLKKLYPHKNILFTRFPSLVTDCIKKGAKNVYETKGLSEYILFFGTVDYYKGVDLLVKAYKQSAAYGVFKLVIAGRGNVSMFEDKNIVCINRFIEDEEIKDLFEKSKVVVYPYRSATMSGVLSIAFYFKRKVIVSDLDFFKFYKSGDTEFFKAGNEKDLIIKLSNLVKDDAESKFLVNTSYTKFYSSRILINDYLALYENH